MKKIKESLKYIKIKDILSFFVFLLMIIPSLLFRLYLFISKKKLLLVTESGTTARDNGYYFYKYVRVNHPSDYCFYVIDKKCDDYNKVKEYGNIIQYGSLKHWLYYMSAKYNISNQKYGNPNTALFYVIHVIFRLYNNRVFLQHGITINKGEWLMYKNTRFKYFISGTQREYDFVINELGYPKKNVLLTGFARWDNLFEDITEDKTILIMPTWRNWLGRETNSLGEKINFKETNYYKNWNELLNNEEFINYIETNNYKVYFYPHINMQKFLDKFNKKSHNIEFLTSNTDIQYMLRKCSIMITDYSSVSLDFGYMLKPVIYFQFDLDEYRKKQLGEGYYSYDLDGYGPVCKNQSDVLNSLKNNNYKEYIQRSKKFFTVKDNLNSQRIYEYLIKK